MDILVRQGLGVSLTTKPQSSSCRAPGPEWHYCRLRFSLSPLSGRWGGWLCVVKRAVLVVAHGQGRPGGVASLYLLAK